MKDLPDKELEKELEIAVKSIDNPLVQVSTINYVNDLIGRLEKEIVNGAVADTVIKNLRCCGNCDAHEGGSNTCPVDQFTTREGWEYCDLWTSDNFTQTQRKEEEYNGN